MIEWNGVYVLYDLHFPAAASVPALALGNPQGDFPESSEMGSIGTSACVPGTTFESNGALVSPSGRYTFVQDIGEWSTSIITV